MRSTQRPRERWLIICGRPPAKKSPDTLNLLRV
jgi:hypothetical protein